MNIYLARHGRTNQNNTHLVSGNSNNAQLIEEGIKQAEKLGAFLENKEIDLIFTSPLDRALDTSNIINKHLNKKLQKDDLLREFDFGDLDGKGEDNEVKEFLIKRRLDLKIRAPKGGSYEDLLKNASKFIANQNNINNKNILIISHAGIMRALISILLKQDLKNHPEMLDTIDCSNGLVYCFDTNTKEISWNNINSDKAGKGLLRRTDY